MTFLAPPSRGCSIPRCYCNGQHSARVVSLCRCVLAPHAPCPMHPERELESRARLLVVGLLLLAAAVSLALWWVGSVGR